MGQQQYWFVVVMVDQCGQGVYVGEQVYFCVYYYYIGYVLCFDLLQCGGVVLVVVCLVVVGIEYV